MTTVERYGRDVPALLRWLGCFGIERGLIRFRWAEFSARRWSIAFNISNSGPDDFDHPWHLHIALLFGQAFIYFPGPKREIKVGEMSESWGFSWLLDSGFNHGDLHLHWGYRCRIFHMPWAWEWVRTSYLLPDETWAHHRACEDGPRDLLGGRDHAWAWDRWRLILKWQRHYPYRYVLRSGEVQDRVAQVEVTEMEWRWRWFTRLPWPRKIRRSIDVHFSDEVGERTGSWKGGTLGCGYELQPGETPLYCLRKMERERKF